MTKGSAARGMCLLCLCRRRSSLRQAFARSIMKCYHADRPLNCDNFLYPLGLMQVQEGI